MSWDTPEKTGGSKVKHYVVQWDDTSDFAVTDGTGAGGLAVVSDSAGADGLCTAPPCKFVVPGVSGNKEYHVRVLAANAAGYGPPAGAVSRGEHDEVQRVLLKDPCNK